MNLTLLINTPLFWVTIAEVALFSFLAALGLQSTKPRELSKKEKTRMTLILLGEIIAIGVVLLFVWSAFRESIVWAFQDHDNLLTATGKITESTTEWRGSPSYNAVGLHFHIGYEYTVNETLYRSDRISYGSTGSSDESFAENYVKKYPVGSPVTVYYEPHDPKKSVLEPDVIEYEAVLVFIMIATLCLFAIPVTLVKIRA